SIFGIPLNVHITFILLLILIYFVGGSIIGTGGLAGVVFVVLVFASVVFHELSHSLVAKHFGISVIDITLLPIGGVSRMAETPDKPLEELLIAVAGPASSFLLAFLLWFTADFFGTGVTISDFSVKGGLLAQLTAVNLVLGLFNLVPAFPMDGGRVLRSGLALYLTPYKATKIAVGVGQGFAIFMFFWGFFSGNIFLILIALFVYLGAEAEERQMGIMVALGGVRASAAMISDIETLTPFQTVGDAAEHFCRSFQGDYPVLDGSRLIGLVTREAIVDTLHRRGPSTPISETMIRNFPTASEQTPVTDVLQKMQTSGAKAIPIMDGGKLKGLITLEQIGRYNMLCSGYSCEFLGTSKA
ncbi:MAG: site-2 protease family protein, partial [Desulfomonilaceae bacterium]